MENQKGFKISQWRTALLCGSVVPARWLDLRTGSVHQNY